jgi:hypothetical protein
MSQPTHEPKGCWVAKLTFPGGSDANSILPIEISQGDGSPVREGVFEFAGKRLAVRDGHARIAYADFVKGKHELYPFPFDIIELNPWNEETGTGIKQNPGW